MMNVKLISFTPLPERISAMAAKLTHTSTTPEEVEKSSDKELQAILKEVMHRGHTSVIEHAYFTFSISGVSRSLTHQLVRHRIASYAQQSQRYVSIHKPSYVIPPSIARDRKAKEKYNEIMDKIWEYYNDLLEMGIPTEDARYVLPNATHSNIIVTMNARSLLNFFDLRCCLQAQWEIRKLAYKMLALVKKEAPLIFKNAGPACRRLGICPEDRKDCPLYPR